MLTSVSAVGTKIMDRRERAIEEKSKGKKPWGPFRYFVLASSVLIGVMWGVILFGGESAPAGTTDFSSNPRALLFMVDSSIKRYAHYEKKGYPEQLAALSPKYLRLDKGSLAAQMSMLSYQRDPNEGYTLSLARTKPDDMAIILTPKGVKHKPSGGGV